MARAQMRQPLRYHGDEVPRLTRDEFPKQVKTRIAAEVGYRCSNPQCRVPTIGPGDPESISNVGVAAHITAASPSGPRFNASLTRAQRCDADNAIHLCQSCGKLVDGATSTHTVEVLRAWKATAIDLQRRALSSGDIDPDGLNRLGQAARDGAASQALETALHVKSVFAQGVYACRNFRREHVTRAFDVKAEIDEWRAEQSRAQELGRKALHRLLVLWGSPNTSTCDGITAMVELLHLAGLWRDRFDQVLGSVFAADYRPLGTTIYHGFDDPFELVNEAFIHEHWKAMDDCLARLNAWADAFIAGRRQPKDP